MRVILASASPRRKTLLESAGVKVETSIPQVEEKQKSGETPEDFVLRNAKLKAYDVYSSGNVVLGADTAVFIEGKILGKPDNKEAAFKMLSLLNGHAHYVITGVCILDSQKKETLWHTTTKVFFKQLSDEEIQDYLATGDSMDKAGAYGIQSQGAFMVDRIEGSYTNVVGLPLSQVVDALKILM